MVHLFTLHRGLSFTPPPPNHGLSFHPASWFIVYPTSWFILSSPHGGLSFTPHTMVYIFNSTSWFIVLPYIMVYRFIPTSWFIFLTLHHGSGVCKRDGMLPEQVEVQK